MQKLQGIIPPMLTLFDAHGNVDLVATRRLARFLARHVHALFVCGTYGNGPLMTVDERKKVLEAVIEETGDQIPVIAHVGTTSTVTTLDLARHAEEQGVIAVAAVPPYYLTHSEANIMRHFAALTESVSVPVYVYNNPRTVGYPVTPELVGKLQSIGVRGIKDSSFDIMMLDEFRLATTPGFDIVLGTEAMFLPAYVLGIKAFVPGLANAFPEVVRSLYDACIHGDLEQAKELHCKVFRLRKVAHKAGASYVGVLEMLHMRGFDAGDPRPPFARVDAVLAGKLKEEVIAIVGKNISLEEC